MKIPKIIQDDRNRQCDTCKGLLIDQSYLIWVDEVIKDPEGSVCSKASLKKILDLLVILPGFDMWK